MSVELKTKLRKVEDDLTGLRTDRAAKVIVRNEAREKFAAIDGYDTASDEYKAAEAAVKGVGEVDETIASAESAQLGILKMLGQQDPAAIVRKAELNEEPLPAVNSLAVLGPDVMKALTKASGSSGSFGHRDLGIVADREAVKADIAGTANARRGAYAGVTSVMRRHLTILDLLPSGTMDNNTLPYTQEGGSYVATEVAEGTSKPEAGITLTDATATAVTIAHYKKILKQGLSDQAALRSIIDSHLRYGVLRRLEGQIVAGDGTGATMTGILNTSGIQTQAYSAVPIADLILGGITKTFIGEGIADGIVVHPADWQAILTAKASGSGEYLAGGPFDTVTPSLWGVPLVPNAAMTQGFALVGDYSMGAQVFVREGVSVLMSDSDGSDFIQNRVTMLGEGRFALAVWRPIAFTSVDIAA